MTKFRITVAYDGTDFVGWQRQASGTSVQGLIETALAELDGAPVTVAGAGRTDAGVHAAAQVASFTLQRVIDPPGVVGALNARLPPAVRVLDAAAAEDAFHPRFGATRKRYRYRIWNAAVTSPFERRYAWTVTTPLDTAAMMSAATCLIGRHDFAAFRAAGSDVPSSERTVYASAVHVGDVLAAGSVPITGGRIVAYDIEGDGFLRHMVRNIVGTLVDIGLGRQPPSRMADVLASRDRTQAGPTAPAAGLALVEVSYARMLAAER